MAINSGLLWCGVATSTNLDADALTGHRQTRLSVATSQTSRSPMTSDQAHARKANRSEKTHCCKHTHAQHNRKLKSNKLSNICLGSNTNLFNLRHVVLLLGCFPGNPLVVPLATPWWRQKLSTHGDLVECRSDSTGRSHCRVLEESE
jgi:hypothetical protein